MASNFWGDTQRLAQSAFADVGNTYQQVLMGRGLYPNQQSLNYEIAADAYEPTVADWKEYGLYLDEQEKENPDPRLTDPNLDPEMDIEP